MRAFIIAMVLLIALSGVAAYVFDVMPITAQDAFTVQDNVRLDGSQQAD